MVARSVRVAGIDCGTNSIRLMIADVTKDGMNVLVPKIMRVCRLGEGVDKNHQFSPAALERTYEYCREFEEIIEKYNIDVIRFGATSATRDAENREEFENTVHDILHVYPEVISGKDEARLSFLGATSRLSEQASKEEAPILVIDLGGGSTEIVLGGSGKNARHIVAAHSMNVGCVRMSERYFFENPPTSTTIEKARKDIEEHIHKALQVVSVKDASTVIGVSGTVTTLSLIGLGHHTYSRSAVDGVDIKFKQTIAACDLVLGLTYDQMEKDYPVIHPRRHDVIGGGALVLKCILEAISSQTAQAGHEIETYTASERGLLDGIVLEAGWTALKG